MIWQTYGSQGSRLTIERTALGWIVSADGGIDHLRRSLRSAVAAATGEDEQAGWILRLERQIERDLECAPPTIAAVSEPPLLA